MKDTFMNGLLAFAGKLQTNRVLSAIKDGFIDNMPVVIVGAFCTLLQWVVFHHDAPDAEVKYLSLANVNGLAWLENLTPIVTTINYGCMNFMAVSVCVLVAMHFAENLGHEGDKTVAAVAVASLVTLMNTSISYSGTAADVVAASNGALELAGDAETAISLSVGTGVLQSFTDSNGLFVGLFVGILATLLYVKLVDSGKLSIKLPDAVPPNVAQSFAVLFPVAVVLIVVSVVGFCVNTFLGQNVFQLITWIMSPLQAIMTGIAGYLVIVFLMSLLWFFGIHGPNVMGSVTTAFLTKAAMDNLAYYTETGDAYGAPNIVSNTFASAFNAPTGSGITGGLIVAVLLFSKRDDYKAICKLAIPCGLFNINEPIIFGMPMVMNPMFAVPFFLSPVVCCLIGYILISVGFSPKFVIDAPWTTPVGILGFLGAGGNLMAGLTQLIAVSSSILIYTPFVIAANKTATATAEA